MFMLSLLAFAAQAAPDLHAEGVAEISRVDVEGPTLGSGIGVRLGAPISMSDSNKMRLVPEIGFTGWKCEELTLIPEAGAQLTFGNFLRPGIFGHVGMAFSGEERQLGGDVGAMFSVVLRRLHVGAQLGVQRYANTSVVGGLQAGISFGDLDKKRDR